MRKTLLLLCVATCLIVPGVLFGEGQQEGATAEESSEAIEKWIEVFSPSALTKEEQRQELEWFIKAAEPYRGMEIVSCAEGIATHKWESEVLAEAFTELTGIKVTHDIIGEGEVVDRIQRQIQTGRKLYDIYVNDADMIGTHLRANSALNLNNYMVGEGAAVTNPMLDLNDWLNPEFGQDYDGNQLQLPDQAFANLYWFRYDWFTDADIMKQFKAIYGYDLGVPVNWAAYEDIANFFTNEVNGDGTIDGEPVYGHMDYGKKSPSLGWRFTDAWLSIAGVGDVGIPNGLPVDEWGIRVENKIPKGASVSRGGATNSPAAVYALTKYVDWMKNYAPDYAASMTWSEAGPTPSRGNIAQRPFQYITWLADPAFNDPESPVTDKNGKPLWRVAPTPHGKYWDEGMKVGYQDAGSWTILKDSVTGDDRAAAWLWAQFASSKTVSLKKFTVGRTPVRKSTVFSDYLAEEEKKGTYGGIVTFYKSPVEYMWTDSGPNVPHYPLLAEQWWKNIATAVTGDTTPQESMDNLARDMDDLMGKMNLKQFSPELNPERDPQYWLDQPGSPKAERPDEEPKTIAYDELIKEWN
ncbi:MULTISPECIES: ABC transporter substrate-binding protein [unclassified Oceanispirochaeta]|uniref:ABC transporter substrate-binding protein n=1 Tax=unclassified Oceanispirochaeta TaxID=2635722 RepID=UPI000E09C90B|nr:MULTISPECIES: ABC transporter substrate-binding protein [unclassified Oceanispirochaeta]MBF9018415.1 carbohydrate ABC transporter substrate-binding protein [Oceanispirochaeta sp. M2]NPD74846.1 carbohydrate ABC transporter substrate-binding protein [Oceanispirochaeta sp. M1]RDG29288.1 carbohydrate ABC transporter substrate-binding protein [Oceanispirochaeta sp. M1]